jgi:hypothetical protein
MKNETFEILKEKWYNELLFMRIEEILANHMIYNHDDMIIQILENINKYYE